jgi:predicted NAD/FAD-binding protein
MAPTQSPPSDDLSEEEPLVRANLSQKRGKPRHGIQGCCFWCARWSALVLGAVAASAALLYYSSPTVRVVILELQTQLHPPATRVKARRDGLGRFTHGTTQHLGRPMRVAIVGAGIAGLIAADTFADSNRKVEARGGPVPHSAPRFDVTVFEATSHIGGHSWTVYFPTSHCARVDDGRPCRTSGIYPVDVGYAYNPVFWGYRATRRLERRFGIPLKGPMRQRVRVFKPGWRPVSAAENADFDRQCVRFSLLQRFMAACKPCASVLYSPISLATWLRLHGFSEAFFIFRLYPVIRFLIVTGSKGEMLASSAYTGLLAFTEGWGTCSAQQPHGTADWYTVGNGSEAHIRALRREVGHWVQTETPVVSVRVRTTAEGGDGVDIVYERGGARQSARFDAVILASAPDDTQRLLGPQAPEWLGGLTTEQITVAVHSDERAMPPAASTDANMAYLASTDSSGLGNAALSVYWDDVHGERAYPRPILTYNPEYLNISRPYRNEVFRHRFKHIHLPTILEIARVRAGVREAHNLPDARLFFAGAWVPEFALSHPGAMRAGFEAAYSVGARVDFKRHFLDAAGWADREGYVERMRSSGGAQIW